MLECVRTSLDHSSACAQLHHFILGANVEVRTNFYEYQMFLLFLYVSERNLKSKTNLSDGEVGTL